MPRPNALVVLAHPDPRSFNHALAHAVRDGFEAAGAACALRDLHAEGFDPVLGVDEARGRASGDPRVAAHVEALRSAAFLAVVHPNCWGAPPAMMKGWMDRVFAPGAAYAFEKGSDQGDVPVGLLRTRGALVVNTTNTPAAREAGAFGDPLARIWADCLLGYCGVARVERRVIGVVATSTPGQRGAWLEEVRQAAAELVRAESRD